MKTIVVFVALLALSACGGTPPCESLKCGVEASGASRDPAAKSAPASEVSATSGALTSEQSSSINLAWSYFGGWGSAPSMAFYYADCQQHQFGANNGKTYWLIDTKSFGGGCNGYFSSQTPYPNYNGYVVILESVGHPYPVKAPIYTTPLVDFLCYAAVRSWGYDQATATNSCDPTLTPYVAAARSYIHDQLFPSTAFWTYWY